MELMTVQQQQMQEQKNKGYFSMDNASTQQEYNEEIDKKFAAIVAEHNSQQ